MGLQGMWFPESGKSNEQCDEALWMLAFIGKHIVVQTLAFHDVVVQIVVETTLGLLYAVLITKLWGGCNSA